MRAGAHSLGHTEHVERCAMQGRHGGMEAASDAEGAAESVAAVT